MGLFKRKTYVHEDLSWQDEQLERAKKDYDEALKVNQETLAGDTVELLKILAKQNLQIIEHLISIDEKLKDLDEYLKLPD